MISRYLYPHIKKADIFPIFTCSLLGALISGLYGIVHDQITFTISPEYFTNLKFKQFYYVDFGFSHRVFVAAIGFVATWWVGLFIGWCFGRRYVPRTDRGAAVLKIATAFLIVFTSTFAFAVGAYLYGSLSEAAQSSSWSPIVDAYKVLDRKAFVTVVYIHNGSYLGGLVGLVGALLVVRPSRPS